MYCLAAAGGARSQDAGLVLNSLPWGTTELLGGNLAARAAVGFGRSDRPRAAAVSAVTRAESLASKPNCHQSLAVRRPLESTQP